MSGMLTVVVGGQYGSEGKGAVAAYVSQIKQTDPGVGCIGVRVGGPNAGHTVIGAGPDGPKHAWRLRTVPVLAVSDPSATLVLAAGSEIDLAVLKSEVDALDAAGYKVTERLMVDSQATILEPKHIEREVEDNIKARLGSTAKGIGAARADRLWRYAAVAGDETGLYYFKSHGLGQISILPTENYLNDMLQAGAHVIVEGTQGYGLGLHAGEYPFCTAGDCRAIDFLAQAGLSPWGPNVAYLSVLVVLRTRPIRVAGNSGPMKGETTWDDLGLPVEHTTVTQLVRRVGEWDAALAAQAVKSNGGTNSVIALTMLDQMFPEIAGATSRSALTNEALAFINQVAQDAGTDVLLVGTGPDTMINLAVV